MGPQTRRRVRPKGSNTHPAANAAAVGSGMTNALSMTTKRSSSNTGTSLKVSVESRETRWSALIASMTARSSIVAKGDEPLRVETAVVAEVNEEATRPRIRRTAQREGDGPAGVAQAGRVEVDHPVVVGVNDHGIEPIDRNDIAAGDRVRVDPRIDEAAHLDDEVGLCPVDPSVVVAAAFRRTPRSCSRAAASHR